MEAFDILARLIGLFYLLAAALATRSILMDHLLDEALSGLTLKPVDPAEIRQRNRVAAMTLSIAAAGAALAMLNIWALPLLGLGLLVQAAYYRAVPAMAEVPGAAAARRRGRNASLAFLVVTAFAAWLAAAGRMSGWDDWAALVAIGAATLGIGGYLLWNLRWRAPRRPAWESGTEAVGDDAAPVTRVVVQARFGGGVLWNADTSEGLDPFDYLPVDLAARLESWGLAYEAAVEWNETAGAPAFTDPEHEARHRQQGEALVREVEAVFGAGNVQLDITPI